MSAVPIMPPSVAAACRKPLRVFATRLVREKPLGAAAAVLFVLFILCAVFSDALAPYGYNDVDLGRRLARPSLEHPFGTDQLGRDLLSRCLHGARLSAIVGLAAAALATVISVVVGALTGYLGGRFDFIVQRLVDAYMAFPELVLLIAVMSVIGPGLMQVVIVLAVVLGVSGSRIIRSAMVVAREEPYVLAARAIGASTARIVWRHLLPNIMPAIIVLFTARVGTTILAESGLSFLGLGVPPPTPTWGGLLSGSGRTFMLQAPWLALAPGLCLTLVLYAANMFGDALRDLLDPRMRGAR